MLSVAGGHTCLSKRVRAGAPGAMLHARDQVKAHELRRFLLAHLFLHALVVADDVARRDRRVAPPVIQNQLAAPGLEGFQVGVDGRQIRAGFFLGDLHVAIEVERIEVPGRVVEDHVFEELRSKGVHQTLGRLGASHPLRPTVRFGFAARGVARHHPLALRVARAVVEFF